MFDGVNDKRRFEVSWHSKTFISTECYLLETCQQAIIFARNVNRRTLFCEMKSAEN